MSSEENKRTVERMWRALSEMEWEVLKDCLHPEVHYQDVPTDDPGARGPENVVKRLSIAWDHLAKQEQITHHIAADGDVVFLDHTEQWIFKTGETVGHRFASMHELKDGKIVLWSDYWDVNNFVQQFPAWFIEHMAKHTAAHFGGEPGGTN